MPRKRTSQAIKGLKPKKTITASQRRARKINIEVARRAKKNSGANYQKQLEKKQRSFYNKLSKWESKNQYLASTSYHKEHVKKATAALYDPNISAAQAMNKFIR